MGDIGDALRMKGRGCGLIYRRGCAGEWTGLIDADKACISKEAGKLAENLFVPVQISELRNLVINIEDGEVAAQIDKRLHHDIGEYKSRLTSTVLLPKPSSLSFHGRTLVSVLIGLEDLLRMQQNWPGVVLNSSKRVAKRSRNAVSPFSS